MHETSVYKSDLTEFEKSHVWHPYTSLVNPLPVYEVESAQGVKLKLKDGRELIDGMSSWWACIHGYNHPTLNMAIESQLKQMAHVMFGGITHRPAQLLAEQLISFAPEGLDNIFFCDSGSVSVEVGMKMALQYHASQGKTSKSKFLTARFGYHGDTTGAMSVCDPVSGMHHLFSDFIPQHLFGPAFPLGLDTPLDGKILAEYEQLISENSDELAAFIIEPVVQGAGGMRIYNPGYLKEIKSYCEANNVLFIADEIATGFGRTGVFFACELAEITPDIMCIGKAISGGYMSFAATLSTENIGKTISSNPPYVFMHGPTFMANPLACSVSMASLELLQTTNWKRKVKSIERCLSQHLLDIPEAKDIRILGAIGVVEFHHQVNVEKAQDFFVSNGVWIRPFRNLVYIMPPYVIEEKELISLVNSIKEMAKNHDCFISG